ncbi:MAG TPA: DivIVA domain-containing protein [bacterium]|nr:DivIVA domain-containing protein [bacterium]
MELRPAEIALRQFSRALFGINPEEVRRFLTEVAAAVERLNGELARLALERTGLQISLKGATAQTEGLRRQVAAAQEKIAVYQEQESLMAKAMMTAQKVTEEVIESTKARAAQTVVEAEATAETTLQGARKEAADLLRDARMRAQEAVKAAERAASAQMAQVHMDSGRLVEQAQKAISELQQAAERQVRSVVDNIEAALSDSAGLTQHLDALAKNHAVSLENLARLQAEVKNDILPPLREMLQALGEDALSPRGLATAVPPEPDHAAAADLPSVPVKPPQAAPRSGEEVPGPPLAPREGNSAAARRPSGEIIVSPVHSYLQASRLVAAVSRLKGVRAARLRSYTDGAATIDVLVEMGTLAEINAALIDGIPFDIVEATADRLVLRITKARSAPAR